MTNSKRGPYGPPTQPMGPDPIPKKGPKPAKKPSGGGR